MFYILTRGTTPIAMLLSCHGTSFPGFIARTLVTAPLRNRFQFFSFVNTRDTILNAE
jgi:hypothetical protein